MKKSFFNVLTVILVLVAINSCTKEFTDGLETDPPLKNGAITVPPTECGQNQAFDLYAGQHIKAGYVYVSNDEDNLYVTYSTSMGWELTEAHLFVGDIYDLPRNKPGIPVPGHFPYSVEDLPDGTIEYTFTIPLSELPDSGCLAVVPHGVVEIEGYEETAWLLDITFKEVFKIKRWGGYAEYCPVDCEDECALEINGWVHGTKLRNATDEEGNNYGFVLGMYNNIVPEEGEFLVSKLFGNDPYAGETTGKMEVHVTSDKLLVTFEDESLMPGDVFDIEFTTILFYAGSFSDLKENYYSETQDLLYMDFPYRYDFTSPRPSSFSFEVPLDGLPLNPDGTITIIGKAFYCVEVNETDD